MLTAGEAYRMVRAAGGDFILDRNREVEEATGPSDVLDKLEDVDVEDLSAVVREHFTAVSVAEKFLASITKPAEPPKKPKAKKPETMVGLERRLLVALESYAGKRGYCTPTLAMLTADLGLQPDEWQKVRGALGELEAKSFISIEKRPNTSNRYTILASTPVDGPALACKPPKVRSES